MSEYEFGDENEMSLHAEDLLNTKIEKEKEARKNRKTAADKQGPKYEVEQKVIIIHRNEDGSIKIYQTEISEIRIRKEGTFYDTLAETNLPEADVFEKLDNDFKKAIAKSIITDSAREKMEEESKPGIDFGKLLGDIDHTIRPNSITYGNSSGKTDMSVNAGTKSNFDDLFDNSDDDIVMSEDDLKQKLGSISKSRTIKKENK